MALDRSNDFPMLDSTESLKILESSTPGYEKEIIKRIIQYAEYLPKKRVAELIFKAREELNDPGLIDKLIRIATKWYMED